MDKFILMQLDDAYTHLDRDIDLLADLNCAESVSDQSYFRIAEIMEDDLKAYSDLVNKVIDDYKNILQLHKKSCEEVQKLKEQIASKKKKDIEVIL